MDSLNTEIKEKILNFLKTKKIGASAFEISKKIYHNRVTVTRYLQLMGAYGILEHEDIAQAKLWRIKKQDKKKILVVDDEPHIVSLVKLSLTPNKYDIIEAFSGRC